jgi:hypothetical protein
MNIHMPRWLVFTAIAAFALFEVVTHAPDFLNAYHRYNKQRIEYISGTEGNLLADEPPPVKPKADTTRKP